MLGLVVTFMAFGIAVWFLRRAYSRQQPRIHKVILWILFIIVAFAMLVNIPFMLFGS